MNEVIHLYHYADYDEREAVRWRMSRDSEWGGTDIETRPMIKSHRSEIFLPATKALSAAGVDDALERLKKMADASGCRNPRPWVVRTANVPTRARVQPDPEAHRRDGDGVAQ